VPAPPPAQGQRSRRFEGALRASAA
jgi:hypothetical protein